MEGYSDRSGTYIMIGLMILLFAFTAVQAFQISALENRISGAGGESAAYAQAQQPAAPAGSAPQQQPAMVGGC